MATTTLVTATRFNLLKNRIHTILGTSAISNPTFGYGQTPVSGGVVGNFDLNAATTDLIDDQDYVNLYIDLVRARVHQIGSAFTIQPFVVGNYTANGASTDKVTEAYITSLESLMTSIENDKFVIDESTQATVEVLRNVTGFAVQGSRLESAAGTWNQTLSYIFTVTFGSDAARRHFFNAGGKIRIAGSRVATATTNTKSSDWSTLLNNVGSVAFGPSSTASTNGFGSGTSIGNHQLTGSYQLVYQGASSAYSGNFFQVYALQTSGSQIQFRVYFADTRSEGTDEPVYGNFFVNTNVVRPDGSVTIGGTAYTTVQIATAPIGAIVTNITQI